MCDLLLKSPQLIAAPVEEEKNEFAVTQQKNKQTKKRAHFLVKIPVQLEIN